VHLASDVLERFAFRQAPNSEIPAIEDHLRDCEECQRIVIQLSPARTGWTGEERRKEPRVTFDTPAKVKLLDPVTSTSPAAHCRVLDISWHGMRLLAQRFVCAGALVQVRMSDRVVLGEVRYCDQEGDDFYVGVRLVETISIGVSA